MPRYVTEEAVARLIHATESDHCNSCHSDADDEGYDMIEIDLGKDRYSEVCCGIITKFRAWLEAK